jgi:hypothetical protein
VTSARVHATSDQVHRGNQAMPDCPTRKTQMRYQWSGNKRVMLK